MGAVRKQRQFGYYASSFLPQKPEELARVLVEETLGTLANLERRVFGHFCGNVAFPSFPG